MFGSALFSTIYKRHSVVLNKPKTTSQAKKINIGEIIKKLNKENKSLFGDLLETRPEKRKREGKKTSPVEQTNSVESRNSSETLWYSKTLPASYVLTTNKRSKMKSEIVAKTSLIDKSNVHNMNLPMKQSKSHEQSDLHKKTSSEVTFSTLPFNLNSPDGGYFSINKINSEIRQDESISEKSRKKPALLLPEVIIRNIPTFPLLNESRETYRELQTETGVNLTRNNEDATKCKDYSAYPSVSKILNATMSESSLAALKRWRQNLISELGEEGFLIHYRGLLDRGSQFHTIIQKYLSGTPETDLKLDPQIEGCWHSLSNVVTDVTNVSVLEGHVAHSSLMYKGVIDCVARYKGQPVVIEWKKSDKQKPEIEKTYDAPLQLSAYFGAMNYDETYKYQVQGGLVVVAYSDGSPAHTFRMSVTDCKKYWSLWLLRLQQYWLQQQKNSEQYAR
ncbi:mitochondrial genome maintenance exonuclease 1-like [Periplaneta americana]|uniref:mitochondrial genome maintenance exonuclease 1-like n=1 Tax=Periplaneta americana TaxID=6978 RepID=UPI0037E73CD2